MEGEHQFSREVGTMAGKAHKARYDLTTADGTPAERAHIRLKRNTWPRVSTVPRAATLLQVAEGELAAAVAAAELEPWGRHADGSFVYRWAALASLLESQP